MDKSNPGNGLKKLMSDNEFLDSRENNQLILSQLDVLEPIQCSEVMGISDNGQATILHFWNGSNCIDIALTIEEFNVLAEFVHEAQRGMKARTGEFCKLKELKLVSAHVCSVPFKRVEINIEQNINKEAR